MTNKHTRNSNMVKHTIISCTVMLIDRGSVLLHIFFFNDSATTEIYTLSLHDALPILSPRSTTTTPSTPTRGSWATAGTRSEEHTSELQSQSKVVCRLLLETKNQLQHITPQ